MKYIFKLGAALLALATMPATAGPLIPCDGRSNNTSVDMLVQCIRQRDLWLHMQNFWQIAQDHPGPDGHPSRNIGEPGYLASAQYVAAKMKAAGYSVRLQQYEVPYFNYTALPYFDRVSPSPASFALRTNYNPATYSGSGNVSALVRPVGTLLFPAPNSAGTNSGCAATDFAGFPAGNIALMQRGTCTNYVKVKNAQAAGAVGAIIFNDGSSGRTGAFRGGLSAFNPVSIPVVLASYQVGQGFNAQYVAAQSPRAHIDVQTIHDPHRADYNVIADSPFGDPNRVVVVEGHLDAIYGAGMLDSASGSATMLEVGLKMAKTRTKNQLRYVWFGGEELGLYGSDFYVNDLSDADAAKIVFDIDADVTATPNYVIAIADPANSTSAGNWRPEMIAASQKGTNYFREYFEANNLPYVVWSNDGTDSWSFSWRGVPNTGVLTGQDCCKTQDLVNLFGGYLGNYEGHLGSFDGGYVDNPFLWGDNLDNNDPVVMETVSKAYAYVTWKLANDLTLPHAYGYLLKSLQQSPQPALSTNATQATPGKRDAVGPDR